jgi:hypothetical protein
LLGVFGSDLVASAMVLATVCCSGDGFSGIHGSGEVAGGD